MAKKVKPYSNAKVEALASHHVETTDQFMTTDQGIPVEHTDDSLKAGPRGPTLLEDFHLREKIMRFDHERIPERVVHARGAAAHGYFETYEPVSICKAKFLQEAGKRTPVFVRFSTVAGSRGSADTVRDVRGFATKFYTEEGNFDLVGNNIPVFFIQDGIKFPDLIHAVKPEPHNEIPQAASAHDSFWDFISLTPESMHMIMWHLSDRAIPRSYANMQGFGVHTFRMIDAKGKSRFVKFHWKPMAGAYSLVWDEAQKIAGKDPDFHRRSLFENIEEGLFPEWELGIQVVEEKDEMKFDFVLLDATKIIPEELVPVRPIGKLVLNRNPDNYFSETEQVAFCVANVVPGIDVTNDPLMQARLFSYLDTQLSRLGGPNFAEIPINRPIKPVSNHQQDGHMRQGIMKSRVNYFPNSLDGNSPHMTPEKQGGYVHYPQKVEGMKTRERSASFNDHYSQATLFYHSLSPVEQEHLVKAAQFELSKVEHAHIREKMVEHFAQVDGELAKKVADKIGVKMKPSKAPSKKQSKLSKALSLLSYPGPDLRGRQVAVLMADGFNMKEWDSLNSALKKRNAKAVPVAPKLGEISGMEGGKVEATKTLFNSDSVMFDSVYILGGKKSIATLMEEPKTADFIDEAYKHLKTIGLSKDAVDVLESGPGIVSSPLDLVKAMMDHRHWERESLNQ
jgi:catalase